MNHVSDCILNIERSIHSTYGRLERCYRGLVWLVNKILENASNLNVFSGEEERTAATYTLNYVDLTCSRHFPVTARLFAVRIDETYVQFSPALHPYIEVENIYQTYRHPAHASRESCSSSLSIGSEALECVSLALQP